MRTNCLDCLDRTNVVQNKLAFRIVEEILDQIKDMNRRNIQGGMKAFQNSAPSLSMMGFTEVGNDAYIFDVLKHMWAENGDVISKQYAGTGSTITKVTKTGK